MFDYQVSKHPHFDEACRAFALRHNLVQLAERAGMNVQILRNKLNPAQPHLLTAPEIWLLTDLTEDSTLVSEGHPVIVSNSDTSLIRSLYRNFTHHYIKAKRSIGVAAGEGKSATEIIAVSGPRCWVGFDYSRGVDSSAVYGVRA